MNAQMSVHCYATWKALVQRQEGARVAVEASAFWTVEPGRGEIRSETLPEPGPGDVLVRTLHSAVSSGTETLLFAGRVPAHQPRTRAARLPRAGPRRHARDDAGAVPAGGAAGPRHLRVPQRRRRG